MYKGGKGQTINRAEYLRWKYMENAEVSIPIEASLSSHDPLGKWQDHKACWYVTHRRSLRSDCNDFVCFSLSLVGRCSIEAHWARACCTCSSFAIRKFTPSENAEPVKLLHFRLTLTRGESEKSAFFCSPRRKSSAIDFRLIFRFSRGKRLARLLIRVFPELALDVMEGEEYLGASALHLAIAYSNNELVNDLIDAGADVHQRAIGRFFLPRDQQSSNPAKNTDYEGLAYFGEFPLAWAACVNNESVYNLLLEVGADPDAQDSFGNMILHMVVVGDKLDMFGYALRFASVIKTFL
jgi:Ankyrin repeat